MSPHLDIDGVTPGEHPPDNGQADPGDVALALVKPSEGGGR